MEVRNDSDRRGRATGREAAGWYVELDAHPEDREREAALIEWLERSKDREAALERCEASVMLARELVERGDVATGRSTRSSGSPSLRRDVVMPAWGWLSRPAVAWGVAAISVVWAAALTVERIAPGGGGTDGAETAAVGTGSAAVGTAAIGAKAAAAGAKPAAVGAPSASPPGGLDGPAGSSTEIAGPLFAAVLTPADADLDVMRFATLNPVALLPGEIVVDVHSVAVLPFDGIAVAGTSARVSGGAMASSADGVGRAAANTAEGVAAERIAAQLHDAVVGQLAGIPGVYVVDRRTSAGYADFQPDQIAAFLGVRGVVDAEVALDGGVVRVSLRMTDAVNDGRRTEATFERPVDELTAVRTEIVLNIADTLAPIDEAP